MKVCNLKDPSGGRVDFFFDPVFGDGARVDWTIGNRQGAMTPREMEWSGARLWRLYAGLAFWRLGVFEPPWHLGGW